MTTLSPKNDAELPQAISEGVFDIPIQLEGSLEEQRGALRETLLAAQQRLARFAIEHGWREHIQAPFPKLARFYDDKARFDHDLLEFCELDTSIELPKTYCAALEKGVLISVSPDLYRELFPAGQEDSAFEKLLTHEMAHRLHIRILKGDEDAMGPVWFYEGFALHTASQFEKTAPVMEADAIWEVVGAEERGDYRQYATVFRYFLEKTSIHELVERAGKEEFARWLKQITPITP